MGNAAASCAPSISSSCGAVKVLLSDGKVEMYTRPVKAAEVMLENPGHFICYSSHLKVGHRIPGLSADQHLHCRRQLYFLLPMEMLYSVLTNEEFTSFTYNASKALKQGIRLNFTNIFPADFCLFPSETKKITSDVPTKKYRQQRSWIPALETIVETPPRRLR